MELMISCETLLGSHHGRGRDGIEETLRDPSGDLIQKEGDERLNEALQPHWRGNETHGKKW